MSNMPYRLTQNIVRGSGNANAIRTEEYVTFFYSLRQGDRTIKQAPVTSKTPSAFKSRTGTSHLFRISNTATTLSLNDLRINQSKAIELYRQYSARMFFRTP